MGFIGYTPPFLYVTHASGYTFVYGLGSASTNGLYILSNLVDAKPRIIMLGNSTIQLDVPTGSYTAFTENGTNVCKIDYTSPDLIIEVLKATDTNLFLKPIGTGKVKFGTYTAGAATDSTGYIDILDAAGNARKLMVQA